MTGEHLWLVQAGTFEGNVVGKPHIVRADTAEEARDSTYPTGPPAHDAVYQVSVFKLDTPYLHVAFKVEPQLPKWGQKKEWEATV